MHLCDYFEHNDLELARCGSLGLTNSMCMEGTYFDEETGAILNFPCLGHENVIAITCPLGFEGEVVLECDQGEIRAASTGEHCTLAP
eukprot:UN20673